MIKKKQLTPVRKPLPPKTAGRKVGTYQLTDKFSGYMARTDQTMIGNNYLVSPSQNVVMNTAGRVGLVKGYTLDGPASAVIDSGILSNYDFTTFKGNVRNLRAGFLTSAGNDGKLQYRYITGTNTVNWVTLKSALTNVVLCFCEYWDTTALVKNVLWVDGSNNIFAWNGAVTTVTGGAGTGPSSFTLTKAGTNTWAQEGYSATGSVVVNGISYPYTGGAATTTLTGITGDTTAIVSGSIAHQDIVTTTLASMTGILATLSPSVVGCGRNNQVYIGSATSNSLYISKVNNYKDYSFTSPTRIVGEGYLMPLDSPPTKFIPQENKTDELTYDMWISEGNDRWAVVRSTLSADLTKETLEHIRLKVSPLQGAMSERLATKMKNHIVFVAKDNTVNALGYVSYQYVPVIQDISYPIIDDQNSYDMTNGSLFYYKNYIYEAVPKSGLIRIYNMTDQTQEQFSNYNPMEQVNASQPWFWEAPVLYPISGFYVGDDGALYGHGFNTSESYKLFTGGSFNGQQIEGLAAFGFDDKGDRTTTKLSDECWVEGYIKQNTNLACTIIGDLGSFQSTQTNTVNGNDAGIVAYGTGGHALGKNNLGSQPLGGSSIGSTSLPAWFHVVLTYGPVPFYLEQLQFYTKGVDLDWQLLAFGTNALPTAEGNNDLNR